jgi:uncharacterized iron-regulated membrane protein
VYMIAWCLVPAVLLALGALPWLDARPRCAPGAPPAYSDPIAS